MSSADAALTSWLDSKGVVVNENIDIFRDFEVCYLNAVTAEARLLLTHHLHWHFQSTGRGVMAKKDLPVGEVMTMSRSWSH